MEDPQSLGARSFYHLAPFSNMLPTSEHRLSFSNIFLDVMDKISDVLRYGRHHGICYDYRSEDPLCKLEEVGLEHDFTTLPDLPEFIPPHVERPKESKLQLGQKASKLLISATTQPPAPGWRGFVSDCQEAKLRKVEQPLLLTDHGKDMRRFLEKRSLRLEPIDFPSEILIEENDEGLSWPTSTRTTCAQWDKYIAHEKLQISKSSLNHLRCTLRNTWTQDHYKNLLVEVVASKKKQILQPISSPLMSADQVSSPLAPSSPKLRRAFTSDRVSLTSLPIESPLRGPAYENCIRFGQDFPQGFNLSQLHPKYFKDEDEKLVNSDACETCSSTVTEKKEKDNNTPEHMANNDLAPARSLVAHLCVPSLASYISGHTFPLPSLPVVPGAQSLFQDENLHNRSTTSGPQIRKSAMSPTKSVVFSEKLETIVPNILHGVNTPFDLKLLTEDLQGHGYEPQLSENIVKSHLMLWKPEKVSLLQEGDDEEEVLELDFCAEKSEIKDEFKLGIKEGKSPGSTEDSRHIEEAFGEPSHGPLAKKEQEHLPHVLPGADKGAISKKRKSLEDIIIDAKRQHIIRGANTLKFSASGSLSSFLGTRQEIPPPHVEESKTPEKHAEMLVRGTPEPVINTDGIEKPYIPALEPPRTIFFSNGHVQVHQALLRFFEVWGGDALNIIYRNLDSPVLLSPKHAIMMTTIQALTQRPLPGQGFRWKSPIHNQLATLSRSNALEILIVLVSTPTFAGNDQSTMKSFTAYCESISRISACQTRPMYVPAGEANLHSSVAKLILEHGFRTEAMIFRDDETNWEKFLVKAGVNAFAAQVVLWLLPDDGSGRPYGLRAFVQMNVVEREARFGSIIGRNMLERISMGIKSAVIREELV